MTSVMAGQFSAYAHMTAVGNFFSFAMPSVWKSMDSTVTADPEDIHVPLLGSDHFILGQSKEDDRIPSLPGLDFDPGFDQYAGYLTVSHKHDRNIFYWYVESQNDPTNDPVIFWTNGGPGCSGLVGFGAEHGPFYFSADGKVSPNNYSWNKLANILYVEQPAGVGFSYSGRTDDYKTGDKQAASDNYKAIKRFFERFPERKGNDFYVASESYGGHYMPQLTKEILDHNSDGQINLKGMLVGNPFVDPYTNSISMFQTWYYHGLLPYSLFQNYLRRCQNPKTYMSGNCINYVEEMYRIRGRAINPYGLDYPVCLEAAEFLDTDHTVQRLTFGVEEISSDASGSVNTISAQPSNQLSAQAAKLLNHTMTSNDIDPPFLPSGDHFQPCEDYYFHQYLNRRDVVTAIHANPKTLPWKDCSNTIRYSQKDSGTSVVGLYKEIVTMMDKGTVELNVLVFSGDDDSICSLAGTQTWIWDLGIEAKSRHTWVPWSMEKQTSGFFTRFHLANKKSTFVFATVHGAGHEVPSYRPKEALELLRRYLNKDW